jgi:hypothetical protein
MAAPTITAVTPNDGFNAFPIGEKIEILFDQEISEFLAENSISLTGPDNNIATGISFQENLYRFANESKYDKVLETLHLKGQVPAEVEVYRCDASGNLLVDINGNYIPYSYAADGNVKSKLVIRPKSFLQEKTDYKLIVSGSAAPDNEWSYLGSRSVFDAEPEISNTGEGIIKTSGNYTGISEDTIVITVTRTGSSTTTKVEWSYESVPETTFELLPLSGRNKLTEDKEIYLEFLGGSSTAFKAGDQWTINLKPVEYLADAYKLDFSTAADQVKDLPTSVSQSPIGLDAPSQEEILAAQTEFQLIKIEPEYGASNISLNTKQIILTFNKDIDPTSITADSIRLFRNQIDEHTDAIDVGYSWIVSGKKLIININRE